MFRAFFRDSACYMIPHVVSSGLALLLVPLYTRVLNPAEYGSLDLFTAFLAIVKMVIALEVTQGLARYYAQENCPVRQSQYASTALWFTIFVYSVFAILCVFNASFLSPRVLGKAGLETAFQIGICYLWCNGLFYLIQNQFRWELRAKSFALISLLITLVTVVSCVSLTYGCSLGLNGMLGGMAIGSAVGLVVGWVMLRRTFRLSFDWKLLQLMLVFSIPFVPSSLAVWASSWIDRIMINHFLTLDQVGIYGIGARVAGIIGLVVSGATASMTPLIFRYFDDPNTPIQIEKIFRVFSAIVLLLFLALTLFAKDILAVFSTPKYYEAEIVVIYLIPATILSFLYVFMPGISIKKKTYLIIWINLVGGGLSVLLNFIFIPNFGIVGAAIANLIGRGGVFAAYVILSQRFYPVPHKWVQLGCATLVATVFAAAVPQASDVNWVRWSLSLAAIGTTMLSFILIGVITRDEIYDAYQQLTNRSPINAT